MQTNSQALSASWRPGKASGCSSVWAQRPELQGSWWYMTLNLKGQEPGALMSGCGQEKMDISGERGQNLFPLLLFVLFWPSPDWAMPTRMSEGRPSLLHQLNQRLVSSMNTDTPASVKVERLKSISRQKCVLVTQLCPTVFFPMDCSLQGSSIHGILQVRILEWVAIPFSRGYPWPRDQTLVSCIEDRFLTNRATRKAQKKKKKLTKRRLAKKDAVSVVIKINF